MDKKLVSAVIVIVLVVAAVVIIRRGVIPNSTGLIKIGVVLPLSGDAAIYGQPVLNAYGMAVEEINGQGGIGGRKIELMVEDGKCDGKAAAAAAQKLIAVDQIKIIFGGGCSGETMAIAPITEQNQVLLFSSLSTSPTVSAAGDYVFRNAPSDLEPARQLAAALKKSFNSIVIITAQAEATEAFAQAFRQAYVQAGGTVGLDERFKKEEKNFRSHLLKAKQAKPESILFVPLGGLGMGHFIKQSREQGMIIPLAGPYFGDDPEFKTVAGEPPEGFTWVDFVPDRNKPEVARFLEVYRQRHQVEPPLLHYIIGAYDAPFILKQAIERVGDDPTKIKNYLYTLTDYSGTIGRYGFDQNGDAVGMQAQIFTIKNGKPVELKK